MADELKKKMPAGLPEPPAEIAVAAPPKPAFDWKRTAFILLGLALFCGFFTCPSGRMP